MSLNVGFVFLEIPTVVLQIQLSFSGIWWVRRRGYWGLFEACWLILVCKQAHVDWIIKSKRLGQFCLEPVEKYSPC